MTMTLKEYFETTTGTGVLSTADADGRVDAALYSRPHMMDDGTAAFIMRERLTHTNLQANPFASYLFIESGPGYKGVRLFLKMVREDANPELIEAMARKCVNPELDAAKGPRHIVYCAIEKILPLIGSKEAPFTL